MKRNPRAKQDNRIGKVEGCLSEELEVSDELPKSQQLMAREAHTCHLTVVLLLCMH